MKKSYIFAAISIFFWSTAAVISKLLLNNYDSFQVLWASAFFAGIALLAVNIFTGNIKKLKRYKLKDYLKIALMGIPGTFLYYVFYYSGNAIMPASQAFIINYLWPIMSVVFAVIILKEKLTLRKILAFIISFMGVFIVMAGDLRQIDPNIILGAVLCFLGAVAYGLFTALNQKSAYDKRISMMINYFVTFALTTVINLANHNLFLPNLTETAGFVWNGMLNMATASTLWIIALGLGKTAKISNLAYITPFLSLTWIALILKEELTVFFIIGLIIIVLGIFVQLKDKKQPAKAAK